MPIKEAPRRSLELSAPGLLAANPRYSGRRGGGP
jgi:hypothetical protein